MILRAQLEQWLARFPRLTIGLVGDLFLDRYLEIGQEHREFSIETGLEAYQVDTVRNVPGALGTVLNNLAALGVGLLVPVTVLGEDGHGFDLLQAIRHLPVDPENILCDPNRTTPTYTKPLVCDDQGLWRELSRLDVRTRAPLGAEITGRLCERVESVWRSSDGLVVLDQMTDSSEGVVNWQVVECLRGLARSEPDKLMFVDSRANLRSFDFGAIKGNRREISAACDLVEDTADALTTGMRQRAATTGQPVYCTCGDDGILVAFPGGGIERVPAYRVEGPVDIVGAGDAATSGIVASRLAGATPIEAAQMGNLVASITVEQLGTTGTASPDQLRQRLES